MVLINIYIIRVNHACEVESMIPGNFKCFFCVGYNKTTGFRELLEAGFYAPGELSNSCSPFELDSSTPPHNGDIPNPGSMER